MNRRTGPATASGRQQHHLVAQAITRSLGVVANEVDTPVLV